MPTMNEDSLAQKTTAEYLEQQLGWELLYAHNNATFGAMATLGWELAREYLPLRLMNGELEV